MLFPRSFLHLRFKRRKKKKTQNRESCQRPQQWRLFASGPFALSGTHGRLNNLDSAPLPRYCTCIKSPPPVRTLCHYHVVPTIHKLIFQAERVPLRSSCSICQGNNNSPTINATYELLVWRLFIFIFFPLSWYYSTLFDLFPSAFRESLDTIQQGLNLDRRAWSMSTPPDLAITIDQEHISEIRVLHAQWILQVLDRFVMEDIVFL